MPLKISTGSSWQKGWKRRVSLKIKSKFFNLTCLDWPLNSKNLSRWRRTLTNYCKSLTGSNLVATKKKKFSRRKIDSATRWFASLKSNSCETKNPTTCRRSSTSCVDRQSLRGDSGKVKRIKIVTPKKCSRMSETSFGGSAKWSAEQPKAKLTNKKIAIRIL